jgi:hypothetical protein
MVVRNYMRSAVPAAVVLICILVALARVVRVDQTTPQGFDEPCHVAAGIKWLDKHDYTLDPLHPPLSRYAIALPLYVFGERFPEFRAQDTIINGYCTEIGNAILYDKGRYTRNLLLARVGMLPFFCLAAVLVYFWASRELGALAGCLAVILFSTLPGILAFSSLAYTDLPTASMQFAFLFVFALWLKDPSRLHTLLVGVCVGLAISTKLTSFLFLPLAAIAMLLVWYTFSPSLGRKFAVGDLARLAIAACIGLVVLWGSYAFSTGHIQGALNTTPDSTPAFQNPQSPPRGVFREVVAANPVVPAPDFVRGVWLVLQMNKQAPESYLFGHEKPGGWWYFFPVALAVKTPIPFLILGFLGLVLSIRKVRRRQPSAVTPAVAIAAIFVATLFVSLRVGTRHVLVVLPLLAVLAGYGASFLWRLPGVQPIWGRLALCLLLAWQITTSVRAQSDFLAYFNEFAPSDPSEVLIKGCDLDCGQDVFRLSQKLRSLSAKHVSVGVWSSMDLSHLDLPPFDILQPHRPATGWVAVSVRALRTGQVVVCQDGHIFPDNPYPRDTLSWLDHYRPVARVGKTILLYDIPEAATTTTTYASPLLPETLKGN